MDMEAEDQSAQVQGQPGRSRRWSGVYKHFDCFRDGDGNDKARCKRCQLVLGASTRNGTSTLKNHVKICWGPEAAAAASRRAPRPPVPGSSSRGSSRGHRETDGLPADKSASSSADLARMIALHGYDPSVVEDDYFRSFVRSLDPEFEVPSRVAIEEMCDEIFDEARRDSFSRLRSAPGRVSLAVGKAKTPEAGEVIYIACHFIDDHWNLHKLVLDALVLEGAERDFTVPLILGVHVYEDDDPEDDISGVISEVEDRLSMLAYDITDRDFPPKLKDYIDSTNSGANPGCTTTTYVDTVLHSIARCLLPDYIDFTADMFFKMTNLKLTRQERLQLLSELDLDLELAFDESWCATYSSLQVLRKRGSTNLVDAELSEQLLCKIWEQVYRGIQTISASTSPTSNLCLAELLKLKEMLHSELARISGYDEEVQWKYSYLYFDEAAVDVLREASGTLDEAIQDSYLIWSVPLALDPRYKLEYIELSFEIMFGSEATKYITEVKNKINKLYEDYIKEYGTITNADHSDGANATVATTSVHLLGQAWKERRRSQHVMAAQVNPETQTELNRYLQDPLAPEDFGVLNWWKENSRRYPTVARMARDALAMPTCSKLSSDQLAQVRSIVRGYSKKPYRHMTFSSSSPSEGGDMIQ